MCMESKPLAMGLPAGVVTSTATATTVGTHNGNSEPASMRPDTMTSASTNPGPNIGISLPSSIALSPSFLHTTPSPYMPNMSAALVPISTGGFNFMNPFAPLGFESMKKKRGRPRKYAPDGSLALAVTPLSALALSPSTPSQKRGRGRPPGSGKNQQLAALGEMLGSIGAGFTPHTLTVATGEDIASKIMSFSQQGPRGICILSANGTISSVTLRQPSISGGIVTYEGRFEILSLTGSFLLTEFGAARSRTGGLSVSLAGPDGRVVGGGIAGVLIAASPVQVVVGSFLCNSKRLLPKPVKPETFLGSTKPMVTNATPPNLPPVNTGNLTMNLASMAHRESQAKVVKSPFSVQLAKTEESGAKSNNAASPITADLLNKEMPSRCMGSQATIVEQHTTTNNALPESS